SPAGADADESERTEEVEWAVNVLQEESDRDQVGHHTPRTRQPIVRLALWPWNIRDRHLGDARATPTRQCWNESVQVAVETDPLNDRGTIGLERGAEVVK